MVESSLFRAGGRCGQGPGGEGGPRRASEPVSEETSHAGHTRRSGPGGNAAPHSRPVRHRGTDSGGGVGPTRAISPDADVEGLLQCYTLH